MHVAEGGAVEALTGISPKACFCEGDVAGLIADNGYSRAFGSYNYSVFWRSKAAIGIGAVVLAVLFSLNFLSPAWNVVVGLLVTAGLLILNGLIGGNQSE